MNREIKFRILVKDKLTSIYKWEYIDLREELLEWDNTRDWFSNPEHSVIQESLSEFTGLKDKNGKEIYESDLIKVISHSKPFEVKWVGAGFFGVSPEYNDFELHHDSVKEFEIIGNIYENPELLK